VSSIPHPILRIQNPNSKRIKFKMITDIRGIDLMIKFEYNPQQIVMIAKLILYHPVPTTRHVTKIRKGE
jgi:hypothetical protein